MNVRVISWALYLVGIGLVLGGYAGLVSDRVSWIGWVIGMIGWGMGFLPGFRKSSVADELARLAQLHASGHLTDEEFEAAKRNALQ